MDKLLELIDNKIKEIENCASGSPDDEEQYIHQINCLIQTRFLLFGDTSLLVL